MTKFTQRKAAPTKNNKYYYEDNLFYQSGYGLPNCTCYAWGRFYELIGKKPTGLATSNAENWYKDSRGYEKGQTPKLGAIICWRKGKLHYSKDGAGHVAIVEHINNDGSFITSNSAYKGTLFYRKTIKKNCKLNGYTFEGFIYPPINFTEGTKYTGSFPTLPKGKKKYFSKGGKGSEVRKLQKFLNWAGVYNKELVVDGIFGKETKAAVNAFQKASAIKVDGKFGKDTLAKAKTFIKY